MVEVDYEFVYATKLLSTVITRKKYLVYFISTFHTITINS